MLPGDREQRMLAGGAAGHTFAVDSTTWDAIVAAAGDRFAVPQPVEG
jgi:hypothetical protein